MQFHKLSKTKISNLSNFNQNFNQFIETSKLQLHIELFAEQRFVRISCHLNFGPYQVSVHIFVFSFPVNV